MTVRELRAHLKKFDQNLPVVYALHSEYMTLETDRIAVRELQPARADGWVHTFGGAELCTVEYLVFPGN
jgi:hypothetical protein